MKQLFTILFLFIGLALSAQITKPIQEAMANYDYETAISLIEKEKPTSALLLIKGKAQKGLSRNAEALNTFQQAISEEPNNPLPHIEAAECCKALAKNKEALVYYQQVLDLNPQNKYVRMQYISLLCVQQQFQEAFGESSLLSETDSSAAVLHLQAQSLEGMENSSIAALGNYHIIQDKYPDDYFAAAKLGQIYNAMEDYKFAIEATEKYRQIDSTNVVVNRQNALSYCLNNDYPIAINRYEYLINQGDSTFLTCYYLGICYYASEKYYEAHDILEVARKYDPNNVNLLYYLGRACAKTSWKQAGVEYLNQAINLAIPKDSVMIRLYKGMVECYHMASLFKEQAAAMKEQYQYDKTNHKLWYDMAFIHSTRLKDKRSTEQCLEFFLKTRSKVEKEAPKLNAKGEITVGFDRYYNAAQEWIDDLKNASKKEKFFKEGLSTNQ